MALHFDFTKCDQSACIHTVTDEMVAADPERWPEGAGDYRTPLLDQLIWATIVVDLRDITVKNLDEWIFRLRFLRHTRGHSGNVLSLTRADIEPFVGLTTNVGGLTRARWMRKVCKNVELDVERALRIERDKALKAAAAVDDDAEALAEAIGGRR